MLIDSHVTMTHPPHLHRKEYTRCLDGACQHRHCPGCHTEAAITAFLAEGRSPTSTRRWQPAAQPVLIYHVPRTGGTFLCDVLEDLGILVVRCDYPGDAAACSERLRHGQGSGLVIMGHTAAALKAMHPDVEFLEYAACWRDPFDICASEYQGIRTAQPGTHLHQHHLRRECLQCDSLSDWVEQYARSNPISNVIGDNQPILLRASNYAEDIESMLQESLSLHVDLVMEFGFEPDRFRPGRWLVTADRAELLRLRELNRRDYELVQTAGRVASKA